MTATRSSRLFISVLLVAAGIALSPAGAGAVTVSLVPSDTTVTIGDDFCVRVTIDAFPNLEGVQLIYSFDSAKIGLQSVSAGDVLTGAPGGFFEVLNPDITAPVDSVWYDAAILSGNSSGPGIIAFFCFQALAEGDAAIVCRRVDLRDSLNQQTLPPCSDAVIHIVGPTAAGNRTWGRLKTIYR
jgi:hypothetical protein